jgi:uncharacterized OB-fold protein
MRKGEFRISICKACDQKIWPPSENCPICFSETILKKNHKAGKLIEFTRSYMKHSEGVFGIVDICGIRVVGSIAGDPLWHGMKVKMTKCGITTNGSVFYQFQPVYDNKKSAYI